MKALLILALLAQPDSAMLAVSGASSMEDLDETQTEQYQYLESHPVNINTASRRQLTASGLFTPYQVSSLLEYRVRTGDILSLAELAAVDGFGGDSVKALSPFISIRSRAPAGESSARTDIRAEASARVWAKADGGAAALSYGGKAKVEAGTVLSAAAAFKRGYAPGLSLPEVFNWSVSLQGRRIPATLIAGDFNARFGQGLLSWSGFSLSGLGSIAAFYKRPTGLTPSYSYTATGLRGAAAEAELGNFTLSAALAMPPRKGLGGTALAGIAWYGLKAQAGLNAMRTAKGEYGASADFRLNTGRTDVFGEAAWESGTGQISGILGAVRNIEYDVKLAGRAIYRKDNASAAIGAQYRKGFASIEGQMKKGVGTVRYLVTCPLSITEELTATLRLKGRLDKGEGASTALRASADWGRGRWKGRLLADAGKASGFAWLIYLEPGFVSERFSLYARATLYACDDWDQRIYIYERDAPGNFNMKAYCGRGWAASAVAGWKIKKQRVHLRASLTDSSRETRLEFHGQYSVEF